MPGHKQEWMPLAPMQGLVGFFEFGHEIMSDTQLTGSFACLSVP